MIMAPSLTTGCVNKIWNGEDVRNAVIQILACKKLAGEGKGRYRLLISDGVTGCPFAMLGSQLIPMIDNKELEKFTVVRVDKYVCHQLQGDRKVIILLSLTVLVPGNEINEKLGNPINSIQYPVSSTEKPSENGINGKVHSSKSILILPSINKILNGEDVPNAVIQILDYKKRPGEGNDRYCLLISDGVTVFPCAFLGRCLNHMIDNKELETFTVVRVDKYRCDKLQGDHKYIVLLSLAVLVPGNEINGKLGNPTNSNAVSSTQKPSENRINGAVYSSILTLPPSLTAGSINKILNGERVPNPVLQIFDYDKCPGEGNNRYCLLISDGVIVFPCVFLGRCLNHMIDNKELETFTVVRVDKYCCDKLPGDRKYIVLLSLAVLVPGNEINGKLGNPIMYNAVSSTEKPSENGTDGTSRTSAKPLFQPDRNPPERNPTHSNTVSSTEKPAENGINGTVHSSKSILTMPPSLTAGSINKILNGERVSNPVLQILGYEKIPGPKGREWFRLLIWDGITACPFGNLGTQLLHERVANKELEKFTIIRVDWCTWQKMPPDGKGICLLSLTVLVPGNEINEKLVSTEEHSENGINGTEPETGIISVTEMVNFLNLETYTMVPSLSTGSIKKILNLEDVPNAVLQILGCKTITCEGFNWYRFLISDGVSGHPIAILKRDLNHMVVNKELERFTVIRVDKWHCTHIDDRKTIHLEDLKVLVPGNEINEMLGDPFNSKTVSSTATLSENGINGTVPTSVSAQS